MCSVVLRWLIVLVAYRLPQPEVLDGLPPPT